MHTAPATIPCRRDPAVSPVPPVRERRLVNRSGFKRSLLVAIDLLAITGAHRLAEFLTLNWLDVPLAFLNPAGYYLFYAPFFAATVYFLGAYKNPDLRRPEKELELVTKGVTLYFVALTCANFLLFKSQGFSRYLLVTWYAPGTWFHIGGAFHFAGRLCSPLEAGPRAAEGAARWPPGPLSGIPAQAHHPTLRRL